MSGLAPKWDRMNRELISKVRFVPLGANLRPTLHVCLQVDVTDVSTLTTTSAVETGSQWSSYDKTEGKHSVEFPQWSADSPC